MGHHERIRVPRVAELIAQFPHCENCGETCSCEIIRLTHEIDGEQDTEISFCSAECMHEYFELMPKMESDQRFQKEANFMYGLVCPACKQRFRQTVLDDLEDE